MTQHVNITISGKVQGVFYRASAKNKADELGVQGFAQNERDGSVYAEAEGNPEQIEQFITWCRQGPPDSKVTDISVTSGAVRHFEKFEIRR